MSEWDWLPKVTCKDISVTYVTVHRCAGRLNRKFELQTGSKQHRHFVGIFYSRGSLYTIMLSEWVSEFGCLTKLTHSLTQHYCVQWPSGVKCWTNTPSLHASYAVSQDNGRFHYANGLITLSLLYRLVWARRVMLIGCFTCQFTFKSYTDGWSWYYSRAPTPYTCRVL